MSWLNFQELPVIHEISRNAMPLSELFADTKFFIVINPAWNIRGNQHQCNTKVFNKIVVKVKKIDGIFSIDKFFIQLKRGLKNVSIFWKSTEKFDQLSKRSSRLNFKIKCSQKSFRWIFKSSLIKFQKSFRCAFKIFWTLFLKKSHIFPNNHQRISS